MKKLLSIFACSIFSASLFVAPISALEVSPMLDAVYGGCDHIDPTDGYELNKCFQSGRGGQ